MDERTIRVVIVDDHQMVADGLALALRRHSGIEVVGVHHSGAAALATLDASAPDVVLMDYHLGEAGTGASAAEAIRARCPNVYVVMISGDVSDDAMLAALEAGASGYVLKTEPSEEVARQIRRAAAGEMLLPAGTLQRLVRLGRERAVSSLRRGPILGALTPRERDVLSLMIQGYDNSQIADELIISYNTVRGHVQSVLEKLEARTKLEAVARAHAEGFTL